MATIAQNLQTIANGLDTIKDNLGLAASASLTDVVTKSASVIEPTGTVSITSNGTTDVTNYASASVNVQPTLQSKSITIEENTTQTISPDSGYDGLSSVQVTTNVSGGGGGGKYCLEIDISKVVTSLTGVQHYITSAKDVDLEGLENLSYIFTTCENMVEASIKCSNSATNTSYMFYNCAKLEKIDMTSADTSYVNNMSFMFYGCTSLEDVGVFPTGNTTNMQSMFSNCPSLTNDSLYNILTMGLNATYLMSSSKKLKALGLSEQQATTCTTFSNWPRAQRNGWSTGY